MDALLVSAFTVDQVATLERGKIASGLTFWMVVKMF
jgi:hypothetical protein